MDFLSMNPLGGVPSGSAADSGALAPPAFGALSPAAARAGGCCNNSADSVMAIKTMEMLVSTLTLMMMALMKGKGRNDVAALGQVGGRKPGRRGASGGSGTNASGPSGNVNFKNPTGTPKGSFRARGTGYYPANNAMEGGFNDRKGHRLYTLQQYLAGKAPYVSVAMDNKNGVPYGSKLRIPELERKYGRQIEFRVVDTGGAFMGKGMSRIDICTASSSAASDATINGPLTLQFV